MYHPRQSRRQEQGVPRREPNTVTKGVGTASSWATGISLSLAALSSGAITLVELGNNPLDGTERGEWTNRMLFYGLACVTSFIVACLYLPALYFAP